MVRPSSLLHEVGKGWDRQPISRDWGHLHEMSAKQPDVCYGLALTFGFLTEFLLFFPICLRDAQRELNEACLGLQRKGPVIFWCPAGGEVTSDFLQVFTGSSESRSQTCSSPFNIILHPLESHVCLVKSPDLRPLDHIESLMGCGQEKQGVRGIPIKVLSAPWVPVDIEKL